MQQSIPEIIRTIPLGHYLILSAALFVIGMMGVLFRRNIIIVFMSIEIMLNAVNLMFAAVSAYHSDDVQEPEYNKCGFVSQSQRLILIISK